MREEKFHRLHILGRHGHQIAGAPAHKIGWGQFVEFLEQRNAHFRQQPERHVMRCPGFEPVQDPRQRRHDGQGN